MLFMCYWCRAQRYAVVRVEVEVQPDREHAERDDAAVEVAAHLFFVSLSRGASAAVAAVVKTWCAVLRRWRFAAVLRAWCCVAFWPN